MTIRITGMNSGLDTEAIIKELASARSMKVENIKKDQTKLSWKIDAWKDLNSKIYALYTDVLSDLRFDYAYSKKTTKVSNPNAASVVTGGDAVNGVQTMEIKQLAKSSYLTGSEIKEKPASFTGKKIAASVDEWTTGRKVNGMGSETMLSELLKIEDDQAVKIWLTVGGEKKSVELNGSMKMTDVADAISTQAGLGTSFDPEGWFVFGPSSGSGADAPFEFSEGSDVLQKLGLNGVRQEFQTAGDNTKLSDLGFEAGGTFKMTVGGEEVELTGSMSLTEVAVAIKEQAGLDARFEEGRFVISAKDTEKSFTISSAEGSLLKKLGLQGASEAVKSTGKVKDGTTKLSELGIGTDGGEVKFKLTIGGKEQEVTLKGSQTLDDVATMLKEKGLNAKFDAGTKRFFISAKESGEANGFEIAAMGDESKAALENLGLYYTPGNYYGSVGYTPKAGEATMVKAQDAKITLNGVEFTSAKNTLEVNGLTITVQQETKEGETITLTTQQDTEGIYDTIKNFIKKYNELINEMDKLYNAKNASKYEPLTSEEKDAMSDKEVEEWEKKIKESLLRRDTTLYSVSDVMKRAMSSTSISDNNGVNGGRDIYLTFFGIETLGYFKAKDNEKNAYHINGDKDDTSVKNNEDKLKKAIANDPDTVISFFKTLATNMYTELEGKMGRTDYSSAFTVYNDKQMETEMKQFESKITTEQKKLNEYTDRWYKKFSQMEVAMAKMQSKQNSLSGLFGQ